METNKTYIANEINFSDGTTLKNVTFKLFNNFIIVCDRGVETWFNTKLVKQILGPKETD